MRTTGEALAGMKRVVGVRYSREYPPLRLKNKVSGAGERLEGAYCIPELTIFLACLKKTDFDETGCQSELERYMSCCRKEKANREAVRQASKEGLLGTEGRKLTKRQVNHLMNLYPQQGSRNAHTPIIPSSLDYAHPLVRGRQKTSS